MEEPKNSMCVLYTQKTTTQNTSSVSRFALHPRFRQTSSMTHEASDDPDNAHSILLCPCNTAVRRLSTKADDIVANPYNRSSMKDAIESASKPADPIREADAEEVQDADLDLDRRRHPQTVAAKGRRIFSSHYRRGLIREEPTISASAKDRIHLLWQHSKALCYKVNYTADGRSRTASFVSYELRKIMSMDTIEVET